MASPADSRRGRGKRGARSAGCLVRAVFDGGVGYLIVHPSGAYNRRSPWSIPKGRLDPGEGDRAAAVRETLEETGVACTIIAELGETRYAKTPKTVVCFLAEAVVPPAATVLEPASWEVDRVEFVPAEEARRRLHPDQRVFVDRAEAWASE